MPDSAAIRLAAAETDYLHARMEEVSRSFALVVPMLEPPFNHHMATAYLLCRVVDNIEDCVQAPDWRQERFAEFMFLLEAPEDAPDTLSRWGAQSWPGLTDDEQRLMTVQGGLPLWQIYAGLSKNVRLSMRRWVAVMAQGMREIEDPQRSPRMVYRNGVQMLETLQDYNQYCFIVAGTVGHMATELAAQHYAFAQNTTDNLLAGCEACGRALQKTNIVKDFAKDLGRGVSFLPDQWLRMADYAPLSLAGAGLEWKRMVLTDVLDELRQGTDYAVSLPYRAKGYRMAALLCLLPAYETILLAASKQERLFTPDHQVKISRMKMAQCKRRAKSMLTDNDAIRRFGRKLEEAALTAFSDVG